MPNANKMTVNETKMQGILAAYLTSRKEETPPTPHLDHDTLAAFTEGTLSERESLPAVAHLSACSFCRHITAELVRLNADVAEEPVAAQTFETSAPSRVSEVLSSLFEKIFGGTENAVFAHEEKKNGEEKDEVDKKD